MDYEKSELRKFEKVMFDDRIIDEVWTSQIIDTIIKNLCTQYVCYMWKYSFFALLERVHAKNPHVALKLARARYETIELDVMEHYSEYNDEDRIDSIHEDKLELATKCREMFTVLNLMHLYHKMITDFDWDIIDDMRMGMKYGLVPDNADFIYGYGIKYQPLTIAHE